MTTVQDYVQRQIERRPLEATLIRKLFGALVNAGHHELSVNDGEEIVTLNTDGPLAEARRELLQLAFNLEEFYLYVGDSSWVRVVMGEEPCDMLVDHTMDLEDDLARVYEWAEKHSR